MQRTPRVRKRVSEKKHYSSGFLFVLCWLLSSCASTATKESTGGAKDAPANTSNNKVEKQNLTVAAGAQNQTNTPSGPNRGANLPALPPQDPNAELSEAAVEALEKMITSAEKDVDTGDSS